MIIAHEQSIFNELKEIQSITEFLIESAEKSRPIHEVEGGLQEKLQQLGLKLLTWFATEAGDGNVGETIEHDGRTLRRSKALHEKTYRSVFGVVKVLRYVYCLRERQAIERAPTDEKLGLPKGEMSYILEDLSLQLTTEATYAEVVRILEQVLHVKTTTRAVETAVRNVGKFAESYHEQKSPVDHRTDKELLVLTVDGKGVPVRRSQEDRLEQELGRKKVTRPSRVDYEKSSKRRSRGGRKCRKQMAYLGAVYSIERFRRKPQDILDERRRAETQSQRPMPHNKRFRVEMNQIVDGAISYGQSRLFDFLEMEVATRNPKGTKPLICLMDGQQSLWFKKESVFQDAIGILDIYHVLEYLWRAAHCFHAESSVEAERFVDKYLEMMLSGLTHCVIGVFRRFTKKLRGNKKTILESVITYFDNNRQYMRYDQYIAAGYPIGSGVVEGGCRHVVKDRMERTGMRWEVEGAQPLINLRTIKINGEWSQFVDYRMRTEQQKLYGCIAA